MTIFDRRNAVSDRGSAPPGEVRRWRAFTLLAVAYFMTAVDLLIVNVALPTIGPQAALSASRTCSGW